MESKKVEDLLKEIEEIYELENEFKAENTVKILENLSDSPQSLQGREKHVLWCQNDGNRRDA